MTQPYTRPEITEEQKKQMMKFATMLISSRNAQRILSTLLGLMHENARLVAECNEHRAARGLEPLPTHEPPGK